MEDYLDEEIYDFSDLKLEFHEIKKDIRPEEIIHVAAEKGRLDVVEKMVKRGADVNVKDDDGWSALDYASWTGNLEIVEFLVSKNAIINENERCPPMDRAAEAGHEHVVQYLKFLFSARNPKKPTMAETQL